MIVRRFVMRDGSPIHRTGRGVRLTKPRNHVVVPALRIGILLVDEGDPAETALECSQKVGVGQITFQSHALLTIAVEQKHSGGPHSVKTVEPGGVFLDVGFYRNEILLNEVGRVLVVVGLGIQPSTRASRRCSTELQQYWAVVLFGCSERLINILTPINSHVHLLKKIAEPSG